jgi:hypothetical protein
MWWEIGSRERTREVESEGCEEGGKGMGSYLYTSLFVLNCSPKYTSGAQYANVPRILTSVAALLPVLKRDNPKSHTY